MRSSPPDSEWPIEAREFLALVNARVLEEATRRRKRVVVSDSMHLYRLNARTVEIAEGKGSFLIKSGGKSLRVKQNLAAVNSAARMIIAHLCRAAT